MQQEDIKDWNNHLLLYLLDLDFQDIGLMYDYAC